MIERNPLILKRQRLMAEIAGIDKVLGKLKPQQEQQPQLPLRQSFQPDKKDKFQCDIRCRCGYESWKKG